MALGGLMMTLLEFFSLLGGVGLFLFGMTIMSSGLKNACGDNLQNILEKATKNKVIAVIIGVLMTMLIQSSSATDVMVIGFVSSGMMTLSQAIGVIMGANIGTTVTAQITAFNLSDYAPLLLFAGVVMYLFMKKHMVKHLGEIIMGFGMLFLGIAVMKESIAPLAESETFAIFLSDLDNPFMALFFGIAFTALLQSSSSSTVIFQTFAVQGLLSYNTAVYLVIGAAVGSVTPNILASLTTNRDGKRTAVLNLIFNVIRAVLLVGLINLIPGILTLIQNLSPGDVGRQIANTHTIFAIIAVLVELPFSEKIIKLTERILPVKPEESQLIKERQLQYMVNLKNVPAGMAVTQTHREITRMARISAANLRRAIDCFFKYDESKASAVRVHEETVNILNHTIGDAMVDLRALDLSEANMRVVSMMSIAITDIERLSDHAENIVEYIEEMMANRVDMSGIALNELRSMSRDALTLVDLAIDIFETEDYSGLGEIEAIEMRIDDQENALISNHVSRLMQSFCDPLAGVIFTDLVTDLERCGDHAINLAYALKERPKDLDEKVAAKRREEERLIEEQISAEV